ncbi:hypothetical protein PG997_005443 [Apiospora hydei]|uniref:Uncharacterized protein n=1 Tax=Apiospora hydei TaxID=1337664 RepID=A0ABR1X556_9PEZI
MTGARTTVVSLGAAAPAASASGTPGIVFGKNMTASVSLSFPLVSGSMSASAFSSSGKSASAPGSKSSSEYAPKETQSSSSSSGDVFASAQSSDGLKQTFGGIAFWIPAPSVPGIRGLTSEDDAPGYFEALRAPNLTGAYDFATPNISAPRAPGKVTEESNSALPGWSISIAVRAGVPFRQTEEHYTAGEVVLHAPESLLTNITDEGTGQKNVTVLDEWELCLIQWDLNSEPYPPALRGDDGTCSSILSPDCTRDLQAEARKQCSNLNITNIPACTNDDTRSFRTSSVAGTYPRERNPPVSTWRRGSCCPSPRSRPMEAPATCPLTTTLALSPGRCYSR